MKLAFIIPLMILYTTVDAQNQIAGTYVYKEFVDIHADGCCREEMILKLNSDNSFQLDTKVDQGDYWYTNFSYGIYNIQDDTISLLSPTPDSLTIIHSVEEEIADSLFKISIPRKFVTWAYIKTIIDGFEFVVIDENLKRTKIEWEYTFPDYNDLKNHSPNNVSLNEDKTNPSVDTISFIFKASELERYFLFSLRNEGIYKPKHVDNIIYSNCIDLTSYKSNTLYVNRNNFINTEFRDVSNFQFIQKGKKLKTCIKYWNGATKYVFKKFKLVK